MPAPAVTEPLPARAADLANGETMFHIGGCASCHAIPKQRNQRRLGGGLALATPFGTFKAPNISPDEKNGIGGWSEAAFVNAMLRGIGRNGEHLYPAFPYTSYQRMAVDDVRDLFAFLKTLPAEARPSEPHELAFPFSVRRVLGLWKLLHLDGKPFTPDPARSAELNRGAYLVEGPGHCAECHSPRDWLGGIVAAPLPAGRTEGKGWVPNITPMPMARQVVGATCLSAVRAHARFRLGRLERPMWCATPPLSDADRGAMAAYLKSCRRGRGARDSNRVGVGPGNQKAVGKALKFPTADARLPTPEPQLNETWARHRNLPN
jgi:mono/diheme cytochrome c family protein